MNPDTVLDWLSVNTSTYELSADSRSIGAGDVFVAYPVVGADGRKHIADAIAQGASAVLYEPSNFVWDCAWDVPHLAVPRLDRQASVIANSFYGKPDSAMFTIAVTGTNGKTSCSQWLGNILSRLGHLTAVIGTLGVGLFRHGIPDAFQETGYTTPDAVLLQRHITKMRDAGAVVLAIEASSIGLHQGRMDGLHVDVALFTNFTRDHLDYHGDEAAYEAAKTMLFDWPGLQHAVINLDDEMGLRLVERLKRTASTLPIYGYTLLGKKFDGITVLSASDIRTSYAGTSFYFESPFGCGKLKTHMVGTFNVSNVLGVIGVLLAKGIAWCDLSHAVEALTAVPGRMQQVGGPYTPLVVIDYAHTPDALEKTLTSLRPIAQQRHGHLWCVFGCGGDRDPGKRPQMGAAALAADHVVITSDNPRTEDPAAIIADIVAGMNIASVADVAATATQVDKHVFKDRAAAILWTVMHAAVTDVVLLAGKGHETYQEIKGRKFPFLDADHASLALAARVVKKG